MAPSVVTSAAVCRSPITPWSAIGGYLFSIGTPNLSIGVYSPRPLLIRSRHRRHSTEWSHIMRLSEGQPHSEQCTAAFFRLDRDAAAVRLHQFFGNEQSEAKPARGSRWR